GCLFLRSLWRIQDTPPGFDAENVLTASLRINLLRYTKPQAREFYRRVIERVESVPGVQAASLARVVPISGDGRRGSFVLEGQGEQEINDRISRGEGLPSVRLNMISPKYFQTMGVALTRGRDFTAQDDEGAPSVVIVNDSFARQYFAGQDPLGKRLRFGEPRNPWSEIIGVARDSKYRELSEDFGAIVYQALAQNHETGMTLHARTAGDPLIVAGTLRREINSIEKNLPLTDMRPLTALIGSSLYPARMGAVLIGVFGSLALSLAAVGLYGVMSYAVSQRTREIGVRMALGAQTRGVLGVLKEAMTLVVIGMVIGLGLAAALSRLIAGFLFGVGAMDLATFAAIPVLLAMVALLASYLPARRAMKIDPMVALRCDCSCERRILVKVQSRLFMFLVLCAAMFAVTFEARAQQSSQPSPTDTAAKPARASEADLAAIKQTALDYIEGYYEGNAERMERALHPELAKRIVRTDPN